MDIELTAYAIGDAPDYLVEEGLENAQYYFDLNVLDILLCFNAYHRESNSALADHWIAAGALANQVLLGNKLYDNSLICLEVECNS